MEIAARALDDDNEDRRKSGVCTDYEWRQCAVTSMREACVRLVTHRLPAPGVCSLPSNLHRASEHGAARVLSQHGSRVTEPAIEVAERDRDGKNITPVTGEARHVNVFAVTKVA